MKASRVDIIQRPSPSVRLCRASSSPTETLSVQKPPQPLCFLLQECLPQPPPPTEPHPLQLPADGEGERGEENGSRGKKTRLLGKQTPVPLLWRSSLNSFPHSCIREREDAGVSCVLSHEINKNFFFFFT